MFIKKTMLYSIVITLKCEMIILGSMCSFVGNAAEDYLRYQERPPEVVKEIERAYSTLAQKNQSAWAKNGRESYFIAGVDDKKIIKNIISNSRDEEINLLDIGSGNFKWCDTMAELINNELITSDNTKIRIFGLRGEQFIGDNMSIIGKCQIFKFGSFKIENLIDSFKERRLDLVGKFDMIVTSHCFRHLIDPIGTLIQAYELLKENTGLFLGDGFNGSSLNREIPIASKLPKATYLVELLASMEIPFLITPYSEIWLTNCFIFKKKQSNLLRLPLKYGEACHYPDITDVKPKKYVTRYEWTKSQRKWTTELDTSVCLRDVLYGSQHIFEFLKQNDLFIESINYSEYFGKAEKSKWVHTPILEDLEDKGNQVSSTCSQFPD